MDDQQNARGRLYGIVIRVANLSLCRRFYLHVVGLGPPVVDSNFWVEFQLPHSDTVMALAKDSALETLGKAAQSTAPSRIALGLFTEDLEAFERRMEEHGVPAAGCLRLPPGDRALVFRDPENNTFMVFEIRKKTNAK